VGMRTSEWVSERPVKRVLVVRPMAWARRMGSGLVVMICWEDMARKGF